MSNMTHYAQTLQIVQAMVEALQAARETILIDRTSLAEASRLPSGELDADAQPFVDAYDAVLREIDAALLPAADNPPPLCELIRWHRADSGERPDADMTVLLQIAESDGDGSTVECGWWDGEQWCLCESGGPAVQSSVRAWAFAEGPEL
jgi:hypothetical protein